jgi:hypothetical protein
VQGESPLRKARNSAAAYGAEGAQTTSCRFVEETLCGELEQGAVDFLAQRTAFREREAVVLKGFARTSFHLSARPLSTNEVQSSSTV